MDSSSTTMKSQLIPFDPKSIGIVSNVCEVKLEQNKISEDLKETLKYKVK